VVKSQTDGQFWMIKNNRTLVVVTFFNNNFVNCKAKLYQIMDIKNTLSVCRSNGDCLQTPDADRRRPCVRWLNDSASFYWLASLSHSARVCVVRGRHNDVAQCREPASGQGRSRGSRRSMPHDAAQWWSPSLVDERRDNAGNQWRRHNAFRRLRITR